MSVIEIDIKQNREKKLREYFQKGARAIQLTNDERFEELWIKINKFLTVEENVPFWDNSIHNLSKNHIYKSTNLGDMIRFFPHEWGQYARKMILISNKKNNEIKVYPEQFFCERGFTELSQDVLKLAWDLASEIFNECLPKGYKPPEYAVSLQILKYPDSKIDYDQTFNLIKESNTGYWTHLGQKLDIVRNKILINSPFDIYIISKLYRYISLIPVVNLVLNPINKIFFKKYSHKLTDYEIIGPAHVDGTRAFTMLIGNRDAIVTEVYDNEAWHEIVLSPKSIHILPGEYLQKEIGIKPTYHRYSISNKISDKGERKPNITLLLGIADPNLIKQYANKFSK